MLETEVTIYPSKPDKVYLFGTCLVDLFYPSAGVAAVALLEKANIDVIYPQAQSCCGQPAYTSGFQKEARKVALAQMAIFEENIPILIPSGSCAGMMKLHYPRLFAGTEHEAAVKLFSNRIYEVSDFLVKVCQLDLEDKQEPEQVVLHTSCSSRREMKSTASGIELVASLKNVTVVEPNRATECCGFGGAFSVRQPHISTAMAQDKVRALEETNSDTFISSDCGCLMNLQGMTKKCDQNDESLFYSATEQDDKQRKADTVSQGEHLLSFVARRAGLMPTGEHYDS